MLSPNSLKRFDDWFGTLAPLAATAAGPLAKAFFPRRARWSDTLIIRPGGLGDLVCLQIAIEQRGIDPRSPTFLIERRSEPWAKLNGLRYEVYDSNSIDVLARLFAEHDAVINTEQRFGLSLAVAELCRARKGSLYAFSTVRGASFTPARTVQYDPYDEHEVSAFNRLLCLAEMGSGESDPLLPRQRRAASSGNLVCCVAGVGAASRSFTGAEWVAFIDSWAGNHPVLVTSAPGDWNLAKEIRDVRASRVELVEGDFASVVGAVKSAEAVLTVDGGMVHVASYFGVPTTAIFTSGRLNKWRPLAAGSMAVARNDLMCRPCTLFGQVPPCSNRLACKSVSLPLPSYYGEMVASSSKWR